MSSSAGRTKHISRRRRLIEAVLLIIGSTILIGTLSSIALVMYTADSRQPTTRTIVIAEGSSELIAQGENPLEIPPTWSFLADDTLVLDNRDDVPHTLGAWYVPPNTVRRFDLQPAYGGFFVCSLHPSGAITLDIQPRDYDFALIAAPTLGFGFSVGIILFIGLSVSRVLGAGDDGYALDIVPVKREDEEDPAEDVSSTLGI